MIRIICNPPAAAATAGGKRLNRNLSWASMAMTWAGTTKAMLVGMVPPAVASLKEGMARVNNLVVTNVRNADMVSKPSSRCVLTQRQLVSSSHRSALKIRVLLLRSLRVSILILIRILTRCLIRAMCSLLLSAFRSAVFSTRSLCFLRAIVSVFSECFPHSSPHVETRSTIEVAHFRYFFSG